MAILIQKNVKGVIMPFTKNIYIVTANSKDTGKLIIDEQLAIGDNSEEACLKTALCEFVALEEARKFNGIEMRATELKRNGHYDPHSFDTLVENATEEQIKRYKSCSHGATRPPDERRTEKK